MLGRTATPGVRPAPPRSLVFAGLDWLRVGEPDLPRPNRVPGGIPRNVLMSVPPVSLCGLSMAISPLPTQLLGFAAVLTGWLVYTIGKANGRAA